jgi:hypothetical protein
MDFRASRARLEACPLRGPLRGGAPGRRNDAHPASSDPAPLSHHRHSPCLLRALSKHASRSPWARLPPPRPLSAGARRGQRLRRVARFHCPWSLFPLLSACPVPSGPVGGRPAMASWQPADDRTPVPRPSAAVDFRASRASHAVRGTCLVPAWESLRTLRGGQSAAPWPGPAQPWSALRPRVPAAVQARVRRGGVSRAAPVPPRCRWSDPIPSHPSANVPGRARVGVRTPCVLASVPALRRPRKSPSWQSWFGSAQRSPALTPGHPPRPA